jgi:hypothetical protein
VNRLSACILLAALAGAPATAGTLWGLYQFDNPANLGQDSTSHHNDLLTLGNATYTPSGKYGGGLALATGDLSTSDGSVPAGFPLGNTNYTLSAWVETSSNGPQGIIGWGNYGTSNQVNALRLDGTGGVVNYWWFNDLTVSATTNNGVFHNVTATFDGTTRKIYLDGTVIAQDTPGSVHNATSANFAIGRTLSGEFLTGTLDNVAIFDDALTAQQVATIASGDFSAFGVNSQSTAPEPGSILLDAAGLALLVGRRRRSRARQA